jgi:amidase
MAEGLETMDATAQAELVRSGEASPAELVEAAIARAEAVNPQLNAVIAPRFERALEEAGGELPDGPFRGVPMLLKDLGCHSAGDQFHEGTAFLKRLGWAEQSDTWLARRFREAGLVFVGKTNTSELGILPTAEPRAYGPTRNPWDLERSPGGSSGGSAAAVAAGVVPIAHANDGGGSIRIPASHCGLVGLKPSRGRVSLAPDYGDLAGGVVAELVVARSVRDVATLLDWVAVSPPGEPYVAPPPQRPFAEEAGADPGRLRIGMLTSTPGGLVPLDPACVAAAESAGRQLEGLGHTIEPGFPPGLDDPALAFTFGTRWYALVDWALRYWEGRTGETIGPDDVEPTTWAIAQAAHEATPGEYLRAIEAHQLLTRAVAEWHESGFDLLLTPTTAEPAPPLGSFEPPPDEPLVPLMRALPFTVFTMPFNATGQPAISLPLHHTEDGLPVGAQLVAPYGREDVLLRVAAQLEQAAPWAERTPPMFAGAGAASR